ncbi:MAG: hypothetical protein MUC43_05265 [Pirellula sp.]|nr:hypothetical protein [Pirellula sp.]
MNDELENREDSIGTSAPQEPNSAMASSTPPTFKVRDPSERPSRKEKSPLQKFLPPVLGGLAALPLATAILWYGFGRDIGGIGPAVAQYVPWIVPKKLRGNGFRADGTFSGNNNSYEPGANSNVAPRTNSSEGFKSSLPSLGQAKPATTPDASPTSSSSSSTNVTTAPAEQPESKGIEQLSQAIQRLTAMKDDWSSIPRERAAQLQAVADFYDCLREIAKSSDSRDSGFTEHWNQNRDAIASIVLNDAKFSALVKRCASGEIADVVSLDSDSHIVTVVPAGFELMETEASEGAKKWSVETKIAGAPLLVEFPAVNETLTNVVTGLKTESPFLLFFKIERNGDTVTAIAIDCIAAK